MGMSNVLLSMGEIKDLHNNTMDDINLSHRVQNPTTVNQNQIVEEIEISVKSTLDGLDAVAGDDDDGFKTPPFRIPTLKECPPAPRKARNIKPWKKKTKRMMSPRRFLLDDSSEVEAMFPLIIRRNISGKLRKVGEENSLWQKK